MRSRKRSRSEACSPFPGEFLRNPKKLRDSHHQGIKGKHGKIKAVRMEVPSLNDMDDGILIKIFTMVIGPATVESDPFFRGFFRGHELEPTVAKGFGNILTLPQVCRRWQKLVESSPGLWKVVFVGPPEEEPQSVHPVLSIPWWAKHSSGIERAHICGNETKQDGDLDTFNLGVVSILLSRNKLRVLHLDDCFANGATQTLLPMLTGLENLEQLQVGLAKDEFVSGVTCLTALTKLRVLELQGMEDACVKLSHEYLPISLEVLGLGSLDVDANGDKFLTNLKVLKLVEVDWKGPVCGHLEHLPSLTELILSDVFHLDYDDLDPEDMVHDLVRLSALTSLTHLEVQGDLERDQEKKDTVFFEELGMEIMRSPPFVSLEKLCLSMFIATKMSPDFGYYEHLTQLQLEGCVFGGVPDAIMELPLLTDLGMPWCALDSFPEGIPKCARTIRHVRLSNNNFEDIPSGLRHWIGIKTLDLSHEDVPPIGEGMDILLELPEVESVWLCKGKKRVALSEMHGDEFFNELKVHFYDMADAFRFAFICGELQGRDPQCRVYI